MVQFRKIEIKELPAEPPTVAPFDAGKAKELQAAWAKHLGVPVQTAGPLGMTFALNPPGEVGIGSSADEAKSLVAETRRQGGHDVWSNQVAVEAPAPRVRLTRPWLMGTHEVTVAQFRQFVTATGYKTDAECANPDGKPPTDGPDWFHDPHRGWRNLGRWKPADAHPVLCVSWNDAAAFCRWVADSTGRPCRLPTGAEWEFACRAGSDQRYSFGADPFRQGEYAVFDREAPSSVGTKKANPFGLHDMEGNAWEWCGSRYGPGYGRTPLTDPQGPDGNTMRAIRGARTSAPATSPGAPAGGATTPSITTPGSGSGSPSISPHPPSRRRPPRRMRTRGRIVEPGPGPSSGGRWGDEWATAAPLRPLPGGRPPPGPPWPPRGPH